MPLQISWRQGALTSARVLPLLGYARAAGVACATIAIGLAVIGFGFTSLPLIFVGLAILGAGTGLVMPVAAGWIATVVPPGTRGRAMGLITAGTFLGQFASPLVTNPLVASGWQVLFTTSAVVITGLGIALACSRECRSGTTDRLSPDGRSPGSR